MHILVVAPYPPIIGGTAAQALWLSMRLAESGAQVSVVTGPADDAAATIPPAEWESLLNAYPAMRQVELHMLGADEARGHPKALSDPVATRLASLALDVAAGKPVDHVLGVYLEPYGVAAMMVSDGLGVPYGIIHAGSDVGRLATYPSRAALYRVVLERAELVLTSSAWGRRVITCGARFETLEVDRPLLEPEDLFTPSGPRAHLAPDDATRVIGLYGRLGPRKGLHETLAACRALWEGGLEFKLAILGGSSALQSEIQAMGEGVVAHTVCVDYLPPWRVPEFLRACDAVLCLENRFGVIGHRPSSPREVALTGSALVLSRELERSQPTRMPLVDGQNVVIVDDPTEISALENAIARVVTDRNLVARLSEHGAEAFTPPRDQRARSWASRFASNLPVDDREYMSLERFQRELLQIYADPDLRARWERADGGAEHDGFTALERKTLVAMAGNPAIAEFAATLRRKRWGFISRRFASALESEPKLEAELKRWFLEHWVLTDSSLDAQVRAFASAAESLESATPDFQRAIRVAEARALALMRPHVAPTSPSPGVSAECLLVRASQAVLVRRGPGRDEEAFVAVAHESELSTRLVRVAVPIYEAIETLGAPSTGAEVVARLVGGSPTAEREAEAYRAIQALLDRSVLRVLVDVEQTAATERRSGPRR